MNTRKLSRDALLCVAALLSLTGTGHAQTALSSTTLAAAVSVDDVEVTLSSAAGVLAMTGSYNTVLYVDREAMPVVSLSGTRVRVHRARGGLLTAHAAGTRAWFGPPQAFAENTPAGSCEGSALPYHPRIVIPTGEIWSCPAGQWARVDAGSPMGTPNTGVTAYEVGDSLRRITTLKFADLAIGSSGGAADLAIGKLLYTLPAGAIVVKSAYMSIALAGAGSTIDADTPDGGLGTTIASGAVAVLGGTAAFENILTGQTFNNLTGTAEVKTVSNQVLTIEAADNHTVYFNLADGWAGAAAITATGTVVIEWVLLQ